MQALGKFFREEGLYTFVRWNGFFTNPPLCITEAELAEAFAIIDKGLYVTDKAITRDSVLLSSARRVLRAAACCAPASTRRR